MVAKRGRPKGALSKKGTKTVMRTRKIVPAVKVSKTGVELTTCYCRKCMLTKKADEFYDATDLYLDSNGKASVCKDCMNEMYNRIYQAEHSVERTLLRVCRMLNIKYDEGAIAMTREQIKKDEDAGKKVKSILSLYKMKMATRAKRANDGQRMGLIGDLTFVEPSLNLTDLPIDEEQAPIDVKEYYEAFWGKGLTMDDYEYLEQEFAEWQRTTKCDTQSELILVKELCFKQNEIRKSRLQGTNVDSLVKSLQEIMKNSALTPAQASAASSGKSAECFGMWIKEIEGLSPAEWHDKQELFKDVDNIDEYIEKYIKRPLKNFVTGSRDFNVEEIIGDDSESLELDDEV